MLVLAIGGLIMLMVFLAFPALQRSQNDTQRRNSLSELQTQLVQYQTNNRGRVPTSVKEWQRLIDDYMNQSYTEKGGTKIKGKEDSAVTVSDLNKIAFLDPDGNAYYIAGFCDMKESTSIETADAPSLTINGIDTQSGATYPREMCNAAKVAAQGEVPGKDAISLSDGGTIDTSVLSWDSNKHQIYAFYHAKCDGENVMYQKDNSTRMVAFVSKLEGAGVFCGNN